MRNKVLLSSAFPNNNAKAVADGLLRAGLLYKFCTSLLFVRGSLIYKIGAFLGLRRFLRRATSNSFRGKISMYPRVDLIRRIPYLGTRAFRYDGDSVRDHLNCNVARSLKKICAHESDLKGVYVYADEAAKIMDVASNFGLKIIYELHIAYYREIQAILDREKQKCTDWVEEGALYDGSDAGKQIDYELQRADIVVVASTFTKKSLENHGFSSEKIVVVPYGFPEITHHKVYHNDESSKLKLLYVGSLGARKGLKYLLEAIEGMEENVELTIVGGGACSSKLQECIRSHHYIKSLPNKAVLDLMRESDILVFPTLAEGFGMVVTESMSQGTPVITTPCGCGGDLIKDGINGWLVPPADSEAVRAKILEILGHRAAIAEVGRKALDTAKSRPWSKYGDEIADLCESI